MCCWRRGLQGESELALKEAFGHEISALEQQLHAASSQVVALQNRLAISETTGINEQQRLLELEQLKEELGRLKTELQVVGALPVKSPYGMLLSAQHPATFVSLGSL